VNPLKSPTTLNQLFIRYAKEALPPFMLKQQPVAVTARA
jgi:hypothetical protein